MSRLWSRNERPALVGVVHLLPLPGAPRPSPGLRAVLDRAIADSRALAEGGVHGLIIENLGDAPFAGATVDPSTVAAMTRIATAVREAVPDRPIGINVLRNDALAALGIAAAVGAEFIRINVHVGAMVTDQGILEGTARTTLLERNRLGAPIRIAADVLVKHAVPLGPVEIGPIAMDTWHRGAADALIVSGHGTGQPTDPDDLDRVRAAVSEAVVWVGSGVSLQQARAVLPRRADVAIVGTWLHEGSDLRAPIDRDRVRAMRIALDEGA